MPPLYQKNVKINNKGVIIKDVLKVSHLSVTLHDGREILRDVSFTLPAGQTTVLLGANGAGKSTIASAISGDPRFSVSGQITFQGQNLLALPPHQRARLGVFTTFQNPVEIPGVSTTEVIRTALEGKKGDFVPLDSVRTELTETAKKLGTDIWFAERELGVGFSGGEKKRGEILQLLSLKPKLAILDEIDSGLDVDACADISRTLHEYQAESSCAYLVITHNLRILRDLKPTRAILLSEGGVAAVGGEKLVHAVEKHGFKDVLANLSDAAPRKTFREGSL